MYGLHCVCRVDVKKARTDHRLRFEALPRRPLVHADQGLNVKTQLCPSAFSL